MLYETKHGAQFLFFIRESAPRDVFANEYPSHYAKRKQRRESHKPQIYLILHLSKGYGRFPRRHG